MISEANRGRWSNRLDRFCAVISAAVPAGLVIGKVGFEMMIGLVVLGWLVRSILVRENPFHHVRSHPLILPWMVWWTCIVISLIVNGPGNKGWAHDIVFIRFVLYAVALLDISQRLPVGRYLLWGLIGGVIWSLINMLSAHTLGYDLLGKPLSRYTAKLKEAGRISAVAAFAAPFLLAEGFFDDRMIKKEKWYFVITGLTAFILLLPTRGRTTIIAALSGFIVSVVIFLRHRFSKRSVLGTALVFLIIGTSLVIFLQDRQMLDLHNFYDRFYYWKVSWKLFTDHMLFGVGVSSFQDAYREMAATGLVKPFVAPDGRIFNLGEVTHAHNLMLMLLASTGILGVVSFSWLFIVAVRCISIKHFGPGLVTWPVVFLVIGLTGFNIFNSEYQALQAFFLVMIGSGIRDAQ